LRFSESCAFLAFMEDVLARVKKEAGGTAELARRLSDVGRAITSQAISQWHRVPAERAHDVERVTGIPRHDLRPDLWPPSSEAAE
jgi:DNA-binding transcriptional regulator YdaS (Cro superfamily)